MRSQHGLPALPGRWPVFAVVQPSMGAPCATVGGLSGAYGMVRYALPHMHRGTLRVGDDAPDATLLALDGTTRFHLRERTGSRPLVVVFGSYT